MEHTITINKQTKKIQIYIDTGHKGISKSTTRFQNSLKKNFQRIKKLRSKIGAL